MNSRNRNCGDSLTSFTKPGVTWLQSEREAAGLSRQDLAVAAGVSIWTIGRIERDEAEPQPSVAAALRRALENELREDVVKEKPGDTEDYPLYVEATSLLANMGFIDRDQMLTGEIQGECCGGRMLMVKTTPFGVREHGPEGFTIRCVPCEAVVGWELYPSSDAAAAVEAAEHGWS